MATTAGKLAVVTGASSGIGYELAKQFCENGYNLIMAAEDNGIHSAADFLRKSGTDVTPVQVDLATYEGVEDLYSQLQKAGPIDAIAINAGVGVDGEFVQTSLADELNLINLNVVSTVHLAKLVAADMAERGEGKILFTSSVAGVMPAPFMAVYAASKAFVLSFSDALRQELKDSGVSVTALMPGPTDTQFFERAHMEDTKVGAGKKDDPALVAKQGFDGLMKGEQHVMAGSLKSRLMSMGAEIMPEAMKAKQHAKMAAPGSAAKH